MIDWARVEELISDLGKDDFREIVDMFLSEVEDRIEGLDQSDHTQFLEDLHFLKGSTNNLGFTAVGVMCVLAENAPKPNSAAEISDCYQKSKQAFMLGLDRMSITRSD
ncbi:Hpt domain-containing protein [Litoreibacter roseus]|uniref:Nickel transporter n=1 Tax=Litoreibacter roseus TaxID=2601869 RepID=A0A6N6JEF3_9RHOB|nr:Hpt domain-containing protein [Litoreibacter roseus]GFE64733.1 nickel transporter [Litoreibacter roseus]